MKVQIKNKTLEESILEVGELAKKQPVKVKDLLKIFGGRGSLLLILFLVIPFCLPIQIPGLSTPFGLAILFISFRMALRHKVWLTQSVLEHVVKQQHIKMISSWGLWFLNRLKPMIHPRFFWVCKTEYLFRLHCIVMALLGLILALPLPIPFSNLLAAWAIFFICLGLIEDDGLLVILGYTVAFLTLLVLFYVYVFFKTRINNWL